MTEFEDHGGPQHMGAGIDAIIERELAQQRRELAGQGSPHGTCNTCQQALLPNEVQPWCEKHDDKREPWPGSVFDPAIYDGDPA